MTFLKTLICRLCLQWHLFWLLDEKERRIDGKNVNWKTVTSTKKCYWSEEVFYYGLARSVIRGDWGNGNVRYVLLTKRDYNYHRVMQIVNEITGTPKASITQPIVKGGI